MDNPGYFRRYLSYLNLSLQLYIKKMCPMIVFGLGIFEHPLNSLNIELYTNS